MLFCACAKSLQLCLTLCDSMDCRPPGYSVHGILQARILEWVAMPSSKGFFPNAGIRPTFLTSPALAGRFLTTRAIWKALGRCKSLGSLKSCLWPTPYYLGLEFCAFPSWVSSGCPATRRGVADCWLLNARHSLSPSWLPSGLTFRAAVMLWQPPLFTDMAGNIFHSHMWMFQEQAFQESVGK